MKGTMTDQYKVGDRVEFYTKLTPDVKDKNGNVIKGTGSWGFFGSVCKIHRSCSTGVVELRPEGGGAKLSRRLIHVRKAS